MSDLDRQLRAYYDGVVQRVDPASVRDLQPEPVTRPRRAWVVAAASAAAVLTIGALTVLVAGIGPKEADPAGPAPTLPPPTTDAPIETTAPVYPGDGPLTFLTSIETVGGRTLAWNDQEIWGYSSGRWSRVASAPDGGTWDLAHTEDTLWALAESGMQYLEGETWHRIDATPPGAWRIAADPGTGIVWVSTGPDLHRWDGTEMISVGHPPGSGSGADDGDGYVGDIAVTSDGTVWAAGLQGYLPWLGGLARYDDDTGSWEGVRPLGGDEDVPAELLAPTPDGDLWVLLADWSEDREALAEAGERPAALTLARYDGGNGEWLVYEGLPEGHPTRMASGGDSVWLARGMWWEGVEEVGGIAGFDGRSWNLYLEDVPVVDTVDGIAVAADGTIWYTLNGELYRLDESSVGATPARATHITLTSAPGEGSIPISTVVGDFEFTTLRFPPGHDLYPVAGTPYGLVALSEFGLWWSTDGVAWSSAAVYGTGITAAGDDVVVHGSGWATRYRRVGDGWVEAARLGGIGRVDEMAFGPAGAVAISRTSVWYSSDGFDFVPARFAPDPALLETTGPGGCDRDQPEVIGAIPAIGDVLATADGFVALTAAHPSDWGVSPICSPLVWFSSDGDLWELVGTDSPFGAGSVVGDIVQHNGWFLATGASKGDAGAVWMSDDGLAWERVDLELEAVVAAAAGDLGWVLAGTTAAEEWPSVSLWFSDDGLEWDGPHPGPSAYARGFAASGLAVSDGIIFGVGHLYDPVPAIGRTQE